MLQSHSSGVLITNKQSTKLGRNSQRSKNLSKSQFRAVKPRDPLTSYTICGGSLTRFFPLYQNLTLPKR